MLMPLNQQQIQNALLNKERLAVLRDLALLDEGADTFEMVYDNLTDLASKAIGAPVALASMVAADYQFFKSYIGLPEPWASRRKTPLSHSFCQHVVATNEPLIVSDARKIDFLKDNGAIPDLNVIAYMGMPITLSDGRTLGSFCTIDGEPRRWTPTEKNILKELSQVLTEELEIKARARINEDAKTKLATMHERILALVENVDTEQSKDDILTQIKNLREEYSV